MWFLTSHNGMGPAFQMITHGLLLARSLGIHVYQNELCPEAFTFVTT
jgi:hypothetical protein